MNHHDIRPASAKKCTNTTLHLHHLPRTRQPCPPHEVHLCSKGSKTFRLPSLPAHKKPALQTRLFPVSNEGFEKGFDSSIKITCAQVGDLQINAPAGSKLGTLLGGGHSGGRENALETAIRSMPREHLHHANPEASAQRTPPAVKRFVNALIPE